MSFPAVIRAEKEKDWRAVRSLNTIAFARNDEAALVDELRREARPCLSLIAEQDRAIVGHILFTPVSLSEHRELKMMGLGPMAVAPLYRRQGIGSRLVRAGLEQCRRLSFGAVVVLGDPQYYSRFGFLPAAPLSLKCQFEAPADAFMVVELQPDYLHGAAGTVSYLPAFSRFA